jgi:hypothetical protein
MLVVSSPFLGKMRDAGLLQLRLSPFRSIESRHPQTTATHTVCVRANGSIRRTAQWHKAQ